MNKLLMAAALIAMAGTAPAYASADLAKSKKCLECHAVDKEVKGPSFKAVAKLYKGTDQAEARLAAKVKQGCAEHWGPNVMPPGGIGPWNVSDAEAKRLAQWILSQ